jgi:ABC-type Fe3+/spermidine/putrescine transport system ATPase subunit
MNDTDVSVKIVEVTKSFGDFTAVNQVSLDIRKGEFFSLLGPSGCGKTTLLRMIGGFELPTDGQIIINGQDVTHLPPYKRPVNMVFQSYALCSRTSTCWTMWPSAAL